MTYSSIEMEELRVLAGAVSCTTEGGVTLFLLQPLQLPEGCTPPQVEALLCPSPRDGYDSRLYFAQLVQGRVQRNWAEHRLVDRNWWAFSWRTQPGLRLAQMVAIHLRGLQ
jgi:hypothetical protein